MPEEEQPRLRHLEGRLQEAPAKRREPKQKVEPPPPMEYRFFISRPLCWRIRRRKCATESPAANFLHYSTASSTTSRPTATPSLDLEIRSGAFCWNKQPSRTFTQQSDNSCCCWEEIFVIPHTARAAGPSKTSRDSLGPIRPNKVGGFFCYFLAKSFHSASS